jgi:acetolactate synthase-1/2/3 large subunit
LFVRGDASQVTQDLADRLPASAKAWNGQAENRAERARHEAYGDLSPKMQAMVEVLAEIQKALPDATLVGDSTQLAYAGNLYWDAPNPRRWFNAATGYGALGYGPPAAVGAALALKTSPVVCLVGDGGFQFCLGTLGAARDENTRVIFVVWNNAGYQEIEDYMRSRHISPIGVTPSAPDFTLLAAAYGIPSETIHLARGADQATLVPGGMNFAPLVQALKKAAESGTAALIEIKTP